jgi:hypothetical protein
MADGFHLFTRSQHSTHLLELEIPSALFFGFRMSSLYA